MFKLFGLTLLIGLTSSVTTVVSGAVFLAWGGVAVCRVEAPDVDLFIPIPTQLADVGLMVARVAMPEQERERMRQEVEPWLPMIETITAEIADLPNGTVLVSVATNEETVRVQKRSGRLTVDVDTEDTDVHVSLPARSAKRIGRQLGMLM
jgi:2-methylaconitate cis-trans-isomerase PrpF